MSNNLIADHWAQILRLGNGERLPDEQVELLRGVFVAGAMAAFHSLTGWNPEAGAPLKIDHRNLLLLSAELTEAFFTEAGELFAEVQH